MTLKKYPFGNIVGKEGNTGNQYFLPFSQCFLHLSKTEIIIIASIDLLANAVSFDQAKILLCGTKLKILQALFFFFQK